MIDNTRPAYRILAVHGFFGPDDNLYDEGSEIYFDGTPNEDMEPLNDVARIRLMTELDRLDNLGRLAAEKAGKAFAGRARNLDGQLEIATALQRENMGLMGTRKDIEIEKVSQSDIAETGSFNPKRGRGRPRKDGLSVSAA
jgi:hypothetical protein